MMFCRNCGKDLPDGAGFCPECGAKLNESVQDTPVQDAPPQAAVRQETYAGAAQSAQQGQWVGQQPFNMNQGMPAPGAVPQKSGGLKAAVIALSCLCVVLAVVLIVVFVRKSAEDKALADIIEASPHVDMNDFDDWEGEYSLPVDGDSYGSFVAFDTPSWSQEPLYTVLTEGVWTSVGIATNPYQVNGDDGVFYLSDFDSYMYYAEFYNDLTCNIKFNEDTEQLESLYYEIMDTDYCDTYMDEDGVGYRFYYGSDGRLYMCLYYDAGDGTYPDISDFVVFELKGDYVEW